MFTLLRGWVQAALGAPIRAAAPDAGITTRRRALVYWLIVAAVFGGMFL